MIHPPTQKPDDAQPESEHNSKRTAGQVIRGLFRDLLENRRTGHRHCAADHPLRRSVHLRVEPEHGAQSV